MVTVVIVAIWLIYLLYKIRTAQRGLLKTSWPVNIQLTARILLFLFYAFASITLHIRTLVIPSPKYEPRNEVNCRLFTHIMLIEYLGAFR